MQENFNPRSPRRERRIETTFCHDGLAISIHAPAKGATYTAGKKGIYPPDFNPRSREGATTGAQLLPFEVGFQSTLPRRERRTAVRRYRYTTGNFNPRSREGRQLLRLMGGLKDLFQSTAPAKGATFRTLKNSLVTLDFNPRSREGDADSSTNSPKELFQSTRSAKGRRIRQMLSHCNISRISIHAPAKGATKRGRLRTSALFISIHAPAKGDKHLPLRHCKRYISIHAPAKATQHNSSRLVPVHNFNPRSRERATELVAIAGSMDTLFQSTLPRRRRSVVFHPAENRDFNPRSREGTTVTTPENCMLLQAISIHAPAKATPKIVKIFVCCGISIHAPAKGDTSLTTLYSVRISIHAPAKGTTLPTFPWHPRQISIHAPAKGDDDVMVLGKAIEFQSRSAKGRHRTPKAKWKNFISIHAPAKGATRHSHMLFDKRIFQSTLPRRATKATNKGAKDMRNFNPRSREGRLRQLCICAFRSQFQSTLPRRATSPISMLITGGIFQSTLPRRATHQEMLLSCHRRISIHAPAKERPCHKGLTISQTRISIHAPAKGATKLSKEVMQDMIFQSTLRAKGATG